MSIADKLAVNPETIPGYRLTHLMHRTPRGGIFNAIQLSVQREVALKVVEADRRNNARLRRDILGAARAASSVSHPHVVACFDAGSHGNLCWHSMELITGGNLAAHLNKTNGALDFQDCIGIILDCARGLEAVYRAGMTHRAINPSTIMLTDEGLAKLGDLALAASFYTTDQGNLTFSQEEVAYVAPEMVRSGHSDIRGDIYALGASLYHISTGSPPFSPMTDDEREWAMSEGQSNDPRNVNPDCPAGLAAVVRKAMAPEPDDRYETPTKFREDLERIGMDFAPLHARIGESTRIARNESRVVTNQDLNPADLRKATQSGLQVMPPTESTLFSARASQEFSPTSSQMLSATGSQMLAASSHVLPTSALSSQAAMTSSLSEPPMVAEPPPPTRPWASIIVVMTFTACLVGYGIATAYPHLFVSNNTPAAETAATIDQAPQPPVPASQASVASTAAGDVSVSSNATASTQPSVPVWASASGVDRFGTWADLTVGAETLRFRWCQPGAFVMGSAPSVVARADDEVQREVTITRGYWLAAHETTQALYAAVMGQNPAEQALSGRHPVEMVSWNEAQSFCASANDLIGANVLRLPTEAEWEYACRAGQSGLVMASPDVSWWSTNSNRSTHPVGSKQPNPWGLYDMLGNVMEWTVDAYTTYSAQPVTDPSSSVGIKRVLRGGSWINAQSDVRAAVRNKYQPTTKFFFTGFRVAASE